MKLLMLDLDYEVEEEERTDPETGKINPYYNLTRLLINVAFQVNHAQGMDSNTSRAWRAIRNQMRAAIEEDKIFYLLLSQSDFDSIYKEVYDCKYPPPQAALAPYLYDELDKIKNRTSEDEDKVQRELKDLEEGVEKYTREKEEDPTVKRKLAEVTS